jgi:DNA topoisomerase-2
LEPSYYKKAKAAPEEFEKRFHLTTSWKTTNMCCFDPNMNIVKYDTIGDILEQFFTYRLVSYEKRRQYMIATLKDSIEELDAKVLFIRSIVEEKLKLMNQNDDDILADLKELGLPPRSDRANPDTLGAYEYLLRMRIDKLKKRSVLDAEEELTSVKKKLVILEKTLASEVWSQELEEFLDVWISTEKHMLAVLSASKEDPVVSKKKVIVKRSTASK